MLAQSAGTRRCDRRLGFGEQKAGWLDPDDHGIVGSPACVAFAKGLVHDRPRHVRPGTQPPPLDARRRDHRVCRGSLGVHVVIPTGIDPYHVTARLWQQSSGLGVRLVPFRVEGESVVAFGRDAIPAGHYRLELHCPGLGLVTAGTHWIDGQNRLELRDVTLPQPSRVMLVPAPGQPVPANDAFAIVRLGREVDSGLRTEVPFAGPHVLGAGRYAVFWRAGGDLREHAFEVGAVPGVLSIPLPR